MISNIFHKRGLQKFYDEQPSNNSQEETKEKSEIKVETKSEALTADAAKVVIQGLRDDLISKVKAAIPNDPALRISTVKIIEKNIADKIAKDTQSITEAIDKNLEAVNSSSKVVEIINSIISDDLRMDAITTISTETDLVQTLIDKAKYLTGKGITKADVKTIINSADTILDTTKEKKSLRKFQKGIQNTSDGSNFINNDFTRGFMNLSSLDMPTKDVNTFMNCFSQETIQAVIAQAAVPKYIDSHDQNAGIQGCEKLIKSIALFRSSNKELFADVIFNKGKSGFLTIIKQVSDMDRGERDEMVKGFNDLKALQHTLNIEPKSPEMEAMIKSQLPADKTLESYKAEINAKVDELKTTIHILETFKNCDDKVLNALIKAVENCQKNEDMVNLVMMALAITALAATGVGIAGAIMIASAGTATVVAGSAAAVTIATGQTLVSAGLITGGVAGGLDLIGASLALGSSLAHKEVETKIDGKQTKEKKTRSIDVTDLEKDTYITTLIEQTIEDLQTKYDEKNNEGYEAAFQQNDKEGQKDITKLNERAQKAFKKAIFFHLYKGITKETDDTKIKNLSAYTTEIKANTTADQLKNMLKGANTEMYNAFDKDKVSSLDTPMADLVAHAGEKNISDATKQLNKDTLLNASQLKDRLGTKKLKTQMTEEVKDIDTTDTMERNLEQKYTEKKKTMLDAYKAVEKELFSGNDGIKNDQQATLSFLKTLQDPQWEKYYSVTQIQQEFSKHWLGISYLYMHMKENKETVSPYINAGTEAMKLEKTLFNMPNPLTFDEKSTHGALRGIYAMSLANFGELKEKVNNLIGEQATALVMDGMKIAGDIISLIGGIGATVDLVNKSKKTTDVVKAAPLSPTNAKDKVMATDLEKFLEKKGIKVNPGSLMQEGLTSQDVEAIKKWPDANFKFLKEAGFINDGSTLGIIQGEKISDFLTIDKNGKLSKDVIDMMNKWGPQLADKEVFNQMMLHGGYGRANFPWETPVDWRKFGHGYEQNPVTFAKLYVANPTYVDNGVTKTFKDTINTFFAEDNIVNKLKQFGLPTYFTQLEQISKGDTAPLQEIVKKVEPLITAASQTKNFFDIRTSLPLQAMIGGVGSYLLGVLKSKKTDIVGAELLKNSINTALNLNAKAKHAGEALRSPQIRYAAYQDHMPELFTGLSDAYSRKEQLAQIDTDANRQELAKRVLNKEHADFQILEEPIKNNLLLQIDRQILDNPNNTDSLKALKAQVQQTPLKVDFTEQDKKDLEWNAFAGLMRGA